MQILALDTATLVSSVAIATPDKLVAEITLQTKKTHSELLMPHIDQIISMTGVAKSDITAIAVSIGPGSFTGLRIGLATAKALAYALRVPIVGVPTLAALAYNCPSPGNLLSPLLDAQKGNVYQAVYEWTAEGLKEIMSARVESFATAIQYLAQTGKKAVVMGEGAVMHRAELEKARENISVAQPHVLMPRAGSVAALGINMLSQGIRHEVMSLEPFYIRRSEAEELWERRHRGCV